jgi:hypothetical protein
MAADHKQFESDFTESEFRQLLHLAKKRYHFISYSEAIASTEPSILWRHDVDISPQRALALARIEAEEEVRSTWFVLLHSEYYNALEAEVTSILRELPRLGHEIGLHFDPSFYPQAQRDLESLLHFERIILETTFGVPVHAFAWHNGDFAPWVRAVEDDELAGMLNVYGGSLRRKMSYCSDSNGIWRFRRLRDVLAAADNRFLHVLTHAEWWPPEVMPPRDRISRAIDGRAARQHRHYDDLLARMGRPNVR